MEGWKKVKHKTTLHFLAERNRRYIPGLILLTLPEVARAYLGVEFAMVTRQVIDCAQGGSAEKLTRAALLLAAVVLCAALPAAALAEENTASIQTQVSETDEDIPWAD